jgi:hypothetical protein
VTDTAIDVYALSRAEAMLRGYDARWCADEYEVLAVEVEFRAPLINPDTGASSRTYQRGGKMDLVVRELTGQLRTLVGEHKTSSEDLGPGSTYWRKLAMDGQVSGYLSGAKALGFDCQGVLYDVLRKVALRPSQIPLLDEQGVKIVLDASGQRVKTKDGKKWRESGSSADGLMLQTRIETPEEYLARCIDAIAADPAGYYMRGDVVRMEAEAREALWDDWQTAIIMREAKHTGHNPRNADSCFKWGSACQFWDYCTGCASIDDPTRFKRSDHVSPELAPTDGLPILSASRLRAARSCLRLHDLAYVKGYRPVIESENLTFGTLIHEALAQWWLAKPEERLEAAIAAIRSPELTLPKDRTTDLRARAV